MNISIISNLHPLTISEIVIVKSSKQIRDMHTNKTVVLNVFVCNHSALTRENVIIAQQENPTLKTIYNGFFHHRLTRTIDKKTDIKQKIQSSSIWY